MDSIDENWNYSWQVFDVMVVDDFSGGNDTLSKIIMEGATFVPPNSLWEFLGIQVVKGSQLGSDIASFRVTFRFKRKIQYYIVAIFIPLLLTIAIQFTVFILPPDCTERVSISVTVMLAVSVMQPILLGDVPKTGQPVYLFYYIQGHIGLNSLITIYMLVVEMFTHKKDEQIYKKLRQADLIAVFICFACVFVLNLTYFIVATTKV